MRTPKTDSVGESDSIVAQVFESIWSFESTSGVRISTVRIVPTPLFKMVTPLSPHRSSLRNEIVNQSELYLYSPLKKAADVYANQNGDRPPQSQPTNGWGNILLLQCSVHLRVIITRSTIPPASPPGSSIGINRC